MIDDSSVLPIRTVDDIDRYLGRIGDAAARACAWLAAQSGGGPLDMLRRVKFGAVGRHPIDGHALNLVEQINQTWTYAVALAARRSSSATASRCGRSMSDASIRSDGPLVTGRLQPLSVAARLAEIPEEEIWLQKRKSARTRRAYWQDVEHFMRTLAIASVEELRGADHKAVIAWERYMRAEEKREERIGNTVEGFDAGEADFRRNPPGRGAFARPRASQASHASHASQAPPRLPDGAASRLLPDRAKSPASRP